MVSVIIYEVIDPELGSSWASVLKNALCSLLVIKRTLMALKETGKQKIHDFKYKILEIFS